MGGCKKPDGIGGLGEGDGGGVGLAEGGEDAFCGGVGGEAGGRRGVEGGEGDGVGVFEEDAEVIEDEAGPLDGGEKLGDADAAVVVGINEGEGFFVELEAFNRAGESDPELLVEVLEVGEVRAGF